MSGFGFVHTSGTARTVINKIRHRSNLDRRLLGGFLEHVGRAVYSGVFQPDSPLADAQGFRTDVAAEIRNLGVPIIRYPGGNFVSGYDWLDGVGPGNQRPVVLDRAWNSKETNQFGTNEFVRWCQLVGAEPMLVFNLGTGSEEMAAALVEYCNLAGGSRWSDLRREHGFEQPHNVRYWCLGNELDGPWQLGHMSAREYGRKALETARQVRAIDPGLKLIAAGSSNTELPTYLAWDQEMLQECYEQVDAISVHNYYGNTAELSGSSTPRYLAMNLDMERQIQEIAAVSDHVQAALQSKRKLWLAFDEWNIWYRSRTEAHMDGHQQVAPRLLEEEYNLEDALLVGGFINTLLRQSGRVRVGCLAQLVNVIAPLVTNDDGVLRQSIYYPYAWALKHARGRVLDLVVESETYPIRADGLQPDFARDDLVPYIDVTVTLDEKQGEACVFVLNRDLDSEREIVLEWQSPTPKQILSCETLTGSDLKATNSFEHPDQVRPQALEAPEPGQIMTLKLPAASYTKLNLAVS
ncbi:alpha-N-arabinofuranosidase [Pseudomonadota bacterium]